MSPAPEQYDVFFSYNWRDREAVENVAWALCERDLKVFLDRWYLVAGRPWPQALEEALSSCRAVAVFLGPQGMGRWQQREKDVALDRQARNPRFPVIPGLLAAVEPALGFLSLNTWVDFSRGQESPLALEILAAAVRGEAPGPDGKTLASGSGDNTVILWDLDPKSWQARACRMAYRNLTRSEWRQFLGDEPYLKTCPELPEPPE